MEKGMNRLRMLRLTAGMTQQQLAEKIGAPYRTIQKYESGELKIENMTLGKAVKIADALGVEVKALLS